MKLNGVIADIPMAPIIVDMALDKRLEESLKAL